MQHNGTLGEKVVGAALLVGGGLLLWALANPAPPLDDAPPAPRKPRTPSDWPGPGPAPPGWPHVYESSR